MGGRCILFLGVIAFAQARLQVAIQTAKLAGARLGPNLDLRALAGFSSLELGRLLNKDGRTWAGGAALHLPLFDAGRLQAGLGVSKAELDLAIARYNQALMKLRLLSCRRS